ncbi:MAG: hypothetical protein ACPHVN_00100 [Luminiphilus sp.]
MGKFFWRSRNEQAAARPADPSEEFDVVAGCYPAPQPLKEAPAPLPYGLDDVKAHIRMAWESILTTLHRYPEGPRMCRMLDDALAQHTSIYHTPMLEAYEVLIRVVLRSESLTLQQISTLNGPERSAYTVATFAWRDIKDSDAVCTAREALMLLDAWRIQQRRKG